MKTVKGFCPKCGNPVALTEYGRYLSKELRRFDHVFEGWCPNCVERVVEHAVLGSPLESPKERKVSGAESKIAK